MGGGGRYGCTAAAAELASLVVVQVLVLAAAGAGAGAPGAATWCIARSGASATALQSALDYACGAGADCTPIQASGLCYLPNTLQSHASYAFNSYYQRSNLAPGSCDFAGTATVTITDPSFGSCTYPSSPSTAGGVSPTTPSTTNPAFNLPPTPPNLGGTGVGGGLTPGFGPTTPDTSLAAAPWRPPFPPLPSYFFCSFVGPLLLI